MSAICLRAVEFRATEPVGDGRNLTGYAAVFDTPTMIRDWLGTYEETISRGAFKKTLRNSQPVMQFDHGRDPATGTIPIGSLVELSEDETGLFVRGRLYDNPRVEPIRQAIEGGAIDGMSFRFEVTKEEWRDASGNKLKIEQVDDMLWAGVAGLKRNITEIDPLHELGPVVFPAYQATSVGVRSTLAQLSGDDRKELIRELAAELGRHPNFTGRLTEAVGGGEAGAASRDNTPNFPPELVLRHKRMVDSGALSFTDTLAVARTHKEQ
jgi:HK97 family phage prohead protease